METATQQRPKLELQLNEPLQIRLNYDKPIIGESRYGQYFLYSVIVDGSEYSFFAPLAVHEELARFKKGDELLVTKYAKQKGGKIIVYHTIEPVHEHGQDSAVVSEVRLPAVTNKLNGNGNGNGATHYTPVVSERNDDNDKSKYVSNNNTPVVTGDNGNGHKPVSSDKSNGSTNTYFQAMLDSYQDAKLLQEKLSGIIDIHRVAITLYISRTKGGLGYGGAA